jgi:hypothetical protein
MEPVKASKPSMLPRRLSLKRIIYENTKKIAISSWIDSQASLLGSVRD